MRSRIIAGGLEVRDVSPDLPFGEKESGASDPSGRMTAVVVDPENAKNVYAASECAGVWKSSDGGHFWGWWSKGLMTGISQSPPTARY